MFDEHMRILIVEDEPMLAFQLEDELTDAGHEVVGCAVSGAEALDLARRQMPDLVFMDMILADGRNGVEAARNLAGSAQVIFLTANARLLPDDMAGALGVICKPWTPSALREVLRYVQNFRGGKASGIPPRGFYLAATRG